MKQKIYAKRRSEKERYRGILFLIIAILLFFAFPPLAIIFFIISLHFFRRSSVWSYGAEGEEIVANTLKKLDKTYHVIHDVVLPGVYGNIDHIVIGRNGIFAIETKNHKGHIKCNGDEWIQEKIGTLGTIYHGTLRNPSRQLKGNVVLLKQFLDKNKGKLFKHDKTIWINAIIVFTNPEAILKLNKPSVTVLRPKELTKFIKNKKGLYFTDVEIANMRDLLMNL